MSINLQTAIHFKAIVKKNNNQLTHESISNSTRLLNYGIFVDSDVISLLSKDDIDRLITDFGINLKKVNSSFYKSFEEMKSKSEFELRFDQILHYLSTYGNIDSLKNGETIFEPSSLEFEEVIAAQKLLKTFTKIEAITREELQSRIESLAFSGIALSSEKISVIVETLKYFDITLDIDKVSNRELQSILSLEMNFVPKNVDNFMKVVMYILTDSTNFVKSRNTYSHINSRFTSFHQYLSQDQIKKLKNINDLFKKYINQYGYKEFAIHSNRYRKLLLVIRKVLSVHQLDQSVSIINKITKLAKKYSIPAKQPDMLKITSGTLSLRQLRHTLEKMNIYQLVRVYNAVADRMSQIENDEYSRVFKIRNGSSYVKNERSSHVNKHLRTQLESSLIVIKEQIKNTLDLSDKIIIDDRRINYAVPTSEKNFIGTVPDFSTISFDRDARIGIAWEREGDIDLHATSIDGHHVGWSSYYKDKNDTFFYSGDMTCLNKFGFAAEYFDINRSFDNSMKLDINLYNSYSKKFDFDIIIGHSSENTDIMHVKDSILTKIRCQFNNNRQSSLGFITRLDDKLTFVFSSSSVVGSRIPDRYLSSSIADAIHRQTQTRLMMSDLYDLLDVHVVSSSSELSDDIDFENVIDLSIESLTTDKFTKLLTSN